MGDMREVFDHMKDMEKERRDKNLAEADPTGWKVHTMYHWSRVVKGSTLNYWPSRKKFQYKTKVMTGDVNDFISYLEKSK